MRRTLEIYARKAGHFALAVIIALLGLLIYALAALASLVACKWLFPGEEWELAEIYSELVVEGAYRRGPLSTMRPVVKVY